MAFIKICYGPYEANYTVKHRFQRIRGITRYLTKSGYLIEIIPTNILNRMSVEMQGRQIFQCDIRNLMFNMNCVDDVLCQRVVCAVKKANSRISDIGNIPKYTPISKGMRYLHKLNNLRETTDLMSSNINLIYEIPYKWEGINK